MRLQRLPAAWQLMAPILAPLHSLYIEEAQNVQRCEDTDGRHIRGAPATGRTAAARPHAKGRAPQAPCAAPWLPAMPAMQSGTVSHFLAAHGKTHMRAHKPVCMHTLLLSIGSAACVIDGALAATHDAPSNS